MNLLFRSVRIKMNKLPNNLKAIRPNHVALSDNDGINALLLQIVDSCLAGVIFIVPFVMGGRHPFGQLLLASLAITMALAWAIRQSISERPSWRPTWALAVLSAGAILVLLQTIPLPKAILDIVAPNHAKILPLWQGGQAASAFCNGWSYISFTPEDTRGGLILFLSYGLVFFVTVQRIKTIQDVERLLQWCAVSAICMAVFGLVQYFLGKFLLGNENFFWFYSHPFSIISDGVKGSFTNRNHFAQFLALGTGPLIWWLLSSMQHTRPHTGKHGSNFTSSRTASAQSFAENKSISFGGNSFKFSTGRHEHEKRSEELKTYLLALALALVMFAGLMSLSRGGMAALVLSAVVSTAICCWASAGTGSSKMLAVVLASCVLIGIALSIFGLNNVGRRLETLTSANKTINDRFGGRLGIWAATAEVIPKFLYMGSGVGSFRKVFPLQSDNIANESIEFTHAENSPLQLLLETGIVGISLLLLGMAMIVRWCIAGLKRPLELRACIGAISGSLIAVMAQSLVDFIWYVPACMVFIAILIACTFRISQLALAENVRRKSVSLPRFVPVVAAIMLFILGCWMIDNRVGPAMAESYWEQYLITLKNEKLQAPPAISSDSASNIKAIDAAVERESSNINVLENVVYWQPSHADAQLALAEAYLRRFDASQANSDNRMTLVNVRNAAMESKFESHEALCKWLQRACGSHWVDLIAALDHTHKTLYLCPLQGSAYIHLAKLTFLEDSSGPSIQDCLNQALIVRPYEGSVVYAAAAEAMLIGNTQQWLELSKRAFRCGHQYQQQIITNLIDNTPPDGIAGIINFIVTEYQPDLESLRIIYSACSKKVDIEQLKPFCQYMALRAEYEAGKRNDSGAASIWLEAQRIHTQLKNDLRALQCARRALECDPNNYQVHYQLALCLMNQGMFADAQSHLHWCLQRSPNDRNVENTMKEALKGKLEAERCATAPQGNSY